MNKVSTHGYSPMTLGAARKTTPAADRFLWVFWLPFELLFSNMIPQVDPPPGTSYPRHLLLLNHSSIPGWSAGPGCAAGYFPSTDPPAGDRCQCSLREIHAASRALSARVGSMGSSMPGQQRGRGGAKHRECAEAPGPLNTALPGAAEPPRRSHVTAFRVPELISAVSEPLNILVCVPCSRC